MSQMHPPCSGYIGTGKHAWPELVGEDAPHAKLVIMQENPTVNDVVVLRYDAIVVPMYCSNRVRLFVDSLATMKVVKVPILG